MPFIRVDPEIYEELVMELGEDHPLGDRPSGEFEYQKAETRFTAGELGPAARWALESLIAAGATHFRVRYDGGYDEGWSYPETVRFSGEGARELPAVEARRALATPEGIAKLRACVAASDRPWHGASSSYAEGSPGQAAMLALDELGGELAARLLGDGFGTGEYELYGAFTADLAAGVLHDHPDAPKPAGR